MKPLRAYLTHTHWKMALMVVLDLGTTGMMDNTKQEEEKETRGIFALTTSAVLLSTLESTEQKYLLLLCNW